MRRLWDVIGDLGPGFCMDTCHSWSAGLDLVASTEELLAITGGIELVHCNDSRDEQGSSRDRHETLTKGQIPPEDILAAVRLANAPVICETPGDSVASDIGWLRDNL